VSNSMVQTSLPNAAAAKNGGVWGVRREASHPFASHTMHLRKNYRPAFTCTRVRSSGGRRFSSFVYYSCVVVF
jgi:hypothetical protein